MLRRFLLSLLSLFGAAALVVVTAGPSAACGGLVAPNGAVRLDHTTTLVAYHAGIEHYVTSFQYGGGTTTNFGSIIPLPAAPTKVEKAGAWTLQRLEREVNPPLEIDAAAGARAATTFAPATVVLQTTVDALDITVLKGGTQGVIDWIKAHGYFVSHDAPAMLDFYARRSPYFLAARFDAAKATARGELEGDGTPIDITIPTASPWVPLHILSLAKIPQAPVQADVFLLTDQAPNLLGLDSGVSLRVSEAAPAQLLSDLASDRNSSWIPSSAWLSFVGINTTASALNHDLAIDPTGSRQPSAVQAGYFTAGSTPRAIHAGLDPVALPGASHGALSNALRYAGVFGLLTLLTLVLGGLAWLGWRTARPA